MGNSYAGDTDHLSLLADKGVGKNTKIPELNERLLGASGAARPFAVLCAQSGGRHA